jgi:hypothetical protein
MEQRQHWWNGSWGNARRDVFLRTDADLWWVEARTGGPEGNSRVWELHDEDKATEAVRILLAGNDGWRDVTVHARAFRPSRHS